jgi:hypothetical protein
MRPLLLAQFKCSPTVTRVISTWFAKGLLMRRTVDPESVPDDLTRVPRLLDEPPDAGEGTWDLFGALAYLVVCAITEPNPRDQRSTTTRT